MLRLHLVVVVGVGGDSHTLAASRALVWASIKRAVLAVVALITETGSVFAAPIAQALRRALLLLATVARVAVLAHAARLTAIEQSIGAAIERCRLAAAGEQLDAAALLAAVETCIALITFALALFVVELAMRGTIEDALDGLRILELAARALETKFALTGACGGQTGAPHRAILLEAEVTFAARLAHETREALAFALRRAAPISVTIVQG